MSGDEINFYYNNGNMILHLFPDEISLSSYSKVFVERPHYLMKFWNSLFLTSSIVIGQIFFGVTAGYPFAKSDFKFKNTLFYIIIILMMMPYQVTLVSNYFIVDKLGLIDNYLAIILPAIFNPFAVFLMKQIIETIPNSILEAAYLDGASEVRIMTSIILPRCKSGVISLAILSFIDSWNMVEQPLLFLKSSYKFPLSMFLTQSFSTDITMAFTCGVLSILPVLLLFLYFEKQLIKGISFSIVN